MTEEEREFHEMCMQAFLEAEQTIQRMDREIEARVDQWMRLRYDKLRARSPN